jgi:hypothetical protein
MLTRTCLLALASAAFVVSAVPASADAPTLLGVSGNWTAASNGSGDAKVCFIMAHPTASTPKKAKRDPIGFLVNDWSAKKIKGEPQVVAGYAYKDGSTVTAEVGADKFTFFTKNDGDAGSAWMRDPKEEARLLDSMKRGAQLVVTGISRRGTMTRDTYSLKGIATALDKIHAACGV